jgi:hypothetical protein
MAVGLREESAAFQAKRDAWIAAIRQLSRIHKCSHTAAIANAIKFARVEPVGATTSFKICVQAGIPEAELVAVMTLIFG